MVAAYGGDQDGEHHGFDQTTGNVTELDTGNNAIHISTAVDPHKDDPGKIPPGNADKVDCSDAHFGQTSEAIVWQRIQLLRSNF